MSDSSAAPVKPAVTVKRLESRQNQTIYGERGQAQQINTIGLIVETEKGWNAAHQG